MSRWSAIIRINMPSGLSAGSAIERIPLVRPGGLYSVVAESLPV